MSASRTGNPAACPQTVLPALPSCRTTRGRGGSPLPSVVLRHGGVRRSRLRSLSHHAGVGLRSVVARPAFPPTRRADETPRPRALSACLLGLAWRQVPTPRAAGRPSAEAMLHCGRRYGTPLARLLPHAGGECRRRLRPARRSVRPLASACRGAAGHLRAPAGHPSRPSCPRAGTSLSSPSGFPLAVSRGAADVPIARASCRNEKCCRSARQAEASAPPAVHPECVLPRRPRGRRGGASRPLPEKGLAMGTTVRTTGGGEPARPVVATNPRTMYGETPRHDGGCGTLPVPQDRTTQPRATRLPGASPPREEPDDLRDRPPRRRGTPPNAEGRRAEPPPSSLAGGKQRGVPSKPLSLRGHPPWGLPPVRLHADPPQVRAGRGHIACEEAAASRNGAKSRCVTHATRR